MAKNAALGFTPYMLWEKMDLKKQYLLFDKIYIDSKTLSQTYGTIPSDYCNNISLGNSIEVFEPPIVPKDITENKENLGNMIFNAQNLSYLLSTDYIETIDWREECKKVGNQIDMQLSVFKQIGPLVSWGASPIMDRPFKDRRNSESKGNWDCRAISLVMQSITGKDTVPLCSLMPAISTLTKKSEILYFVLQNLPEPDDHVSWSQLEEFKADPNTKASYYSLLKWINEIAKKEMSKTEIIEEYEYLYHQYQNQYNIHKLKQKQGVLEIIVNAGLNVLSNTFSMGGIKTDLFSLWKREIELLEAETKFIGKEVAYIFKANQIF